MSQNFEELYKKLKEEYELSKKDNDEICKEYEATIDMLSESVESFKKEKASLEQKISKYDQEFKTIKKEKESLFDKNKEKNSDIQNLNKQNDRLSNEVKRLNEEKALFDSKIVSLENDNEHFQNKIREYEALAEDLENQLESALEENITLQTEFETFKQTTGEQLIRKDDEIRDIKNDLLNKDKFIQRLQTRANNGILLKNLQKSFMETKTNERRRLTLFPGMKGDENDLIKIQKTFNNKNVKFDFGREKQKSVHVKSSPYNSENKARGSAFMSGLGSLTRLINKKEEMSKSNKVLDTKKKENIYASQKNKDGNKNLNTQNSFLTDKNSMTLQIEEISETSEKEEKKESKEFMWTISQENQIEYKNKNINKDSIIKVDTQLNNKYKMEKGVIIEDLQKILESIRKRKEKLVNTKKANKERIKNLKQK